MGVKERKLMYMCKTTQESGSNCTYAHVGREPMQCGILNTTAFVNLF